MPRSQLTVCTLLLRVCRHQQTLLKMTSQHQRTSPLMPSQTRALWQPKMLSPPELPSSSWCCRPWLTTWATPSAARFVAPQHVGNSTVASLTPLCCECIVVYDRLWSGWLKLYSLLPRATLVHAYVCEGGADGARHPLVAYASRLCR